MAPPAPTTSVSGYVCPGCREEQGSPEELVAHHAAAHAHLCPHCLQGFPTPSHLVTHFSLVHGGEGEAGMGEPEAVTELRAANLSLGQEVRLLERLLASRAEHREGDREGLEMSPGEKALLAANSPQLVQVCEKMVTARRTEVAIAKQLKSEAEKRLERANRAKREASEKLDNAKIELGRVVMRGDKELARKDAEIAAAETMAHVCE